MAARRADLDGVDAQHTMAIYRRVGLAHAVSVVSQDDELESGARCRSGDVIDGAGPIRTARVDVNRATNRRHLGGCAAGGARREASSM